MTDNETTALQALAKASEGPDKTLGKALEKLGSSDSFLNARSLVGFFRIVERAKKGKDYTMCRTVLERHCYDETVQTILNDQDHRDAEGTDGTLDETGWATLAYEIFNALFPNGKTTAYIYAYLATAMEQLPKREQDESLETFHGRYMKLMKDIEWARARNLFGLPAA